MATFHNPLAPIELPLTGDIYTSPEVMLNLEILCDDFGSRWGGSEEEGRAAEFLRQRFEAYGLSDARLEPFEYVGWVRGPATLRIVSPIERTLPCFSLPMCPAAAVRGSLVSVGDGAPGDFEAAGERLRGAFSMVCSQPPRGLNRTVHRSEKYQRSALGGAVAFLYVNQYPGYGPETGSIANDREALIPGVGISYEDGQLLQRLERRYGTLQLHLETTDQSPTTGGYRSS